MNKYSRYLHAYVLMTNHAHLLVTPQGRDSISRMVQHVGRYKGCAVSSEEYLLVCMCYIEPSPVRAELVETPGEYRWSSYADNTSGRAGVLLLPYQAYIGSGETVEEMGLVYRELFRTALAPEQAHAIRGTM